MLIAIGFTLSTMTQFRVGGLPVGVAELLLISCMLVHIPLGLGVHGSNKPNRFLPVLFLLFLVTVPGFIFSFNESNEGAQALYDFIAWAWVIALFTYLQFGFDHTQIDLDRLAQLFLAFSSLYFAIMLALIVVEPELVYVDEQLLNLYDKQGDILSDEEPRLRLIGFSNNPNQVALHALVCAFFAIHLVKRSGFLLSSIALVLAGAVGFFTGSDAFLFAMVALVSTAIVLGIMLNQSVIWGLVILVPALAALVIFGPQLAREILGLAQAGDQDLTRFNLWRNGIEAGFSSPVFGLGPGAWSGFEGPFGDEESHNVLIDYFSQAGVIGVALMLLSILGLLFRSIIVKRATLFAGLSAIFVYAMFHNVLRQPVMWLAVYLVAQSVWSGSGSGAQRSRSRRRVRRR